MMATSFPSLHFTAFTAFTASQTAVAQAEGVRSITVMCVEQTG
jgi:hypothetical protein